MSNEPATPVTGTDVPDHVTAALSRLLEQDKNKTGITSLVTSVVTPIQDLESALWQLLTQRRIDTAVGSTLDALGKLVNQGRLGYQDDDYRRLIKARILANSSRGRTEDLLAIAKLVVNNTATTDKLAARNIATAPIRVLGDRVEWGTGQILISMLRDAAAAGVRPVVEIETWPTTTLVKNAGSSAFDAGASSVQTFGGDGYVEFVAALFTDTHVMGLSAADSSVSDTTISYGLKCSAGVVYKIENGSQLGIGTFTSGDTMRVERVGTVISYKKNGTAMSTSSVASSGALLVDCSLFTLGATIQGVKLVDSGTRKQITWQNVVGVQITPPMPASAHSARARLADATAFNGSAYYPTTAAATKTAIGGLGTWSAGWLCDELSGNLAAAFGSTALVASGSPTYGNKGARGGADLAIGLNSANDAFSATAFDLTATVDLCIVWVGYHAGTPTQTLFSKYNSGANRGFLVNMNSGSLQFNTYDGSATTAAVAGLPVATWYVGMVVADRSTGKIRCGYCPLGGSPTVSAELSQTLTTTNVSDFAIGANSGSAGSSTSDMNVAALYVASGASACSGLSASMSTALTAFANYINRLPTGYTSTPSYGNGAEDSSDKYPRSADAITVALGNRGSFASGAVYLCNETSGNLTAALGSPSLTASSLTYSNVGPRGGNDKAIGFGSTTANANGGNVFNVAAGDDMIIAWIGKFSATPGASVNLFSKRAGGSGFNIFARASGDLYIDAYDGTDRFAFTAASSQHVGAWHAGLCVIDRGATNMRIGTYGLATGLDKSGTSSSIAGMGALTSVDSFLVGATGTDAPTTFQLAALYISTGASVASGLASNFTSALASFAAQINRYYGGPLSAALE